MSQSKKKYIDLFQHVNKYKQVVLETLSCTFNGIRSVTYVTCAVKKVQDIILRNFNSFE